jgi:hypothetical protein
MKFIYILIITLLTSLSTYGQISDVRMLNNYVQVFTENNKVLSTKYLSNNEEFIDNSSKFYIIRRGNYLVLMDHKSKFISQLYIDKKSKVKGVYGKFFTVQVGNYVRTYNMECKQTNQAYSPNGNN